ncbi:helix-turn-helix domain-containing protein, partial [Geobacillus sp. WSUCF1]|uniref:helix-turn-helix domain-containing protein n=1 Tax=Geobacillus sp. WSUCF1 TaxID=886559 RepID=UPI000518372D
MDMTLTAKIKIYPTAEQAEVLKDTLSAYRQACNAVSVVIFDTKVLAQAKLHDMTYRLLRSNYALRSQMAQSVIKTVIARYRSL